MENAFINLNNEELQERIDIIRHKLKFIEKKPTVICLESADPITISGGLIPGMVNTAGGVPVLMEANVSWDDIRSQDPDMIIVMLRGLSIEETMKEIPGLLAQPNFADLKAVKNNRVYLADGARYFYQSGPATVDSIEILAEIINPKQFIFGYEGNGWIKFSV